MQRSAPFFCFLTKIDAVACIARAILKISFNNGHFDQRRFPMKKIILIAIAVFLSCSCSFAGTVTDKDGNKYKTVKMGKLEWMAEDSRFEAAGSECYGANQNPDDCIRVYGRAINDENMCPVGWRLPTVNDLNELENQFLPTNFEQMTEKQKRHALPDAKKAFGAFLDSKNFPLNSWGQGKTNIYHVIFYSPLSGQPSLRSFYRASKDDFFFLDGMTVAKVRCVREGAEKSGE